MKSFGLKIFTEPAVEPVTVAEIKTQLRITAAAGSVHDARLANLAKSARQGVEKRIRRTLINTTLELYLNHFPRNPNQWDYRKHRREIELQRPPVSAITSITYKDTSGTNQTFVNYTADLVSLVPRIVPAYGYDWPCTQDTVNAVTVKYTAGYGATAASVPEPIRQAIIMIVIDMFLHPEANVEISLNKNNQLDNCLNMYTVPAI